MLFWKGGSFLWDTPEQQLEVRDPILSTVFFSIIKVTILICTEWTCQHAIVDGEGLTGLHYS